MESNDHSSLRRNQFLKSILFEVYLSDCRWFREWRARIDTINTQILIFRLIKALIFSAVKHFLLFLLVYQLFLPFLQKLDGLCEVFILSFDFSSWFLLCLSFAKLVNVHESKIHYVYVFFFLVHKFYLTINIAVKYIEMISLTDDPRADVVSVRLAIFVGFICFDAILFYNDRLCSIKILFFSILVLMLES